MDKEESINKINDFIRKVSEDFKIERVIFFGSRVDGNNKKESDIDLIIVSNDFKGMDFFKRVSKMYDYQQKPEDSIFENGDEWSRFW